MGIPPQIYFRIKKKKELGTITGKQKQGNMAQGSNIVTRLQFPSMHLAFMMASFSARHKFIQKLQFISSLPNSMEKSKSIFPRTSQNLLASP